MLWLGGLHDVQGKDVASLGPHRMAVTKLSDNVWMLRGHIVHLCAVLLKVVQAFVALDIAVVLPWTADYRLLASIEGLTGILMCAWSGGFFFAVVTRVQKSAIAEGGR